MSTTEIIVRTLIVLLLAPVVGCLFAGIDRKITAHLQGRLGPSLMQPWYDFKKLINKENVVVNRYQNIYILVYLGDYSGYLLTSSLEVIKINKYKICFVFIWCQYYSINIHDYT